MKQGLLVIFIALYALVSSQQCVAQSSKKLSKVLSFVPPAYAVLDMVAADMNKDGELDYAMVLRSQNEENNGDELRPLLIVTGKKNGHFELFERNDSVVLCRNCGGVFGDPFQKISYKDQLLSLEHNIGSSWRWSRNISFRYDTAMQDFVLHDDNFQSYRKANASMQSSVLAKNDTDGTQLFRNYSFRQKR